MMVVSVIAALLALKVLQEEFVPATAQRASARADAGTEFHDHLLKPSDRWDLDVVDDAPPKFGSDGCGRAELCMY